jgi:FMN-dependent NADH-azoreductase
MNLFRLDASIRLDGSISRAVADTVERAWEQTHSDARVTRRDVGLHPVPADAWPIAATAGYTAESDRSPEQKQAVALASALADELLEADSYLFAVPLYNFGVSQHFKTWLDLVITDPRLAPGGDRVLEGRPAVLVAVRGGGYGEGTPREGWDHATPWLRRILSDVWGLDLQVVEAELTLAGVNPALNQFIGLAEQSLSAAHVAAEQHGAQLGTRALQIA